MSESNGRGVRRLVIETDGIDRDGMRTWPEQRGRAERGVVEVYYTVAPGCPGTLGLNNPTCAALLSNLSSQTAVATQIERRVVLIDGRRLAELMIDHGVGVATARTFAVQKLDLDYFDEEGS
jgi:restriction endonuclease Mrr